MNMKTGDFVEITVDASVAGNAGWVGLQCEVVKPLEGQPNAVIKPLSDRPDGHGRGAFGWPKIALRVVEPFTDADYQEALASIARAHADLHPTE